MASLLKLGIDVAQSTVAKYMAKRRPGSGQTWKVFLRNHAAGIAAMDFLVVPTINFRLLFVLVILRHKRRRLRAEYPNEAQTKPQRAALKAIRGNPGKRRVPKFEPQGIGILDAPPAWMDETQRAQWFCAVQNRRRAC